MPPLHACLRAIMERLNRFLMPFLWVYLSLGMGVVIAASEIDRRFNFASTLQKVSLLLALTSMLFIVVALATSLMVRRLRADLIATAQLLGFTCAFSFVVLFGSTHATSTLRLQGAQELKIGDRFIAINGATSPRLMRDLEALLHPSLPLDRVHLSNPGGSVAAAVSSAHLLRKRGVQIAVIEGDCESACAIMALHFPRRYLAPGASLGLHNLHSPTGNAEALAVERAALMTSFADEGLPVPLLDSLMTDSKMTHPPRSFLLSNRLVTGCWDIASQQPDEC